MPINFLKDLNEELPSSVADPHQFGNLDPDSHQIE
jgi:hypothetical protein